MSSIAPTIGRKVWLWVSTNAIASGAVVNSKQPFDASIVYVHADGTINLAFFDHSGQHGTAVNVPIFDPKEADQHMGGGSAYATWMPYQVGQSKK